MPIQPINIVNENLSPEDLINELAKLQKMLRYLLNGQIDFENIRARSIKADNIEVGTLTAEEIAANTITADKMNVTELSAITANLGSITAGIVTGILIQTALTGRRIVLNGSALISYNNTTQDGFTLDGVDGFLKFFTGGIQTGGIFRDNSQTYEQMLISHDHLLVAGNTQISLDTPNLILGNTIANVYIGTSATALGVAQADSTATDVAGLKADFNLLLSNLRSMGILS